MTAISDTRPGASAAADGRTAHFGVFYGVRPLMGDGPVTLVHGNCQAESLRVMLDGGDLATVRMPPVHELTPGDLPHLRRWLARAAVLVTQPIHAGYRGLPLGADQLAAALPAHARVARFPVVRFAGLYPTHVIVRPPSDPALTPPVVPYHDLRGLAAAAGVTVAAPTPARVRAIAAASLAALRARETAHDTVVVSDLFERPGFEQLRTLNHPGNAVLATIAARVRARLGLGAHAADPGRPLLDGVHAPRTAAVIAAFDLPDAPREHWVVDGRTVSTDAVRAAHAAFYAAHPDAVAAGMRRHAETLRILVDA